VSNGVLLTVMIFRVS